MQAMIFAAGLGTRLQPLTNKNPKALVEINGKTLLERCIVRLKEQGITDIVINVHHEASLIIDFLKSKNDFGLDIQISDETKELLDTGGGILKANALLKKNMPVLIVNVDVLTNLSFKELMEYHSSKKALATLVVRQRETARYLLFDERNQLTGWKNIKTGDCKVSRPIEFPKSKPYAFSGIHIIQPELISMIEERGKFSIIDLYLRLAKTQRIHAFIDDKSEWMDLGKYEQLKEAENMVKRLDQK